MAFLSGVSRNHTFATVRQCCIKQETGLSWVHLWSFGWNGFILLLSSCSLFGECDRVWGEETNPELKPFTEALIPSSKSP